MATASLELGIDIGPVELRAPDRLPAQHRRTLLQRVGRSGHARGATAKGRVYPTTRDELVEATALLRAVRRGQLDRVLPPHAPLDVLAQQVVAACAADPWPEDQLFALVRRAAPYADLNREDFDAVVGHAARTGSRPAAAGAARTSTATGSTASPGPPGCPPRRADVRRCDPETADYRVVAIPTIPTVGTVNEDWAIEIDGGRRASSSASTSWRIRRVEAGIVRVVDAQGGPRRSPSGSGRSPGRTAELSAEVIDLREALEPRLARRRGRGRGRALEAEAAASDAAWPRGRAPTWRPPMAPSAALPSSA